MCIYIYLFYTYKFIFIYNNGYDNNYLIGSYSFNFIRKNLNFHKYSV